MWPQIGGRGTTTPFVSEISSFPWSYSDDRSDYSLSHISSARTLSRGPGTLYLGSFCVLTGLTSWSTTYACPLLEYQSSLQMPLELRHSPRRSFQRMYRRILQPYRLLTLSERMHRYRPILPALQEEESIEQRSNSELIERRPRYSKRRMRRQGTVPHQNYPNQTAELQIIPSEEWARNPERFADWPAEPQIIITSDVQMQTDDGDLVNETPIAGSSASTASLQPSLFSHTFRNTAILSSATAMRSSNTGVDNVSERAPVTTSINYFSTNETSTSNLVVDMGVQVPSTHDEESSRLSLDSGESMDAVVSDRAADTDSSALIPYRISTRAVALLNLPAPTIEAKRVANSVIRHARNNKTLNQKEVVCLNCDLFPILPVTGACGHTRCTKCIQNNGACPCGGETPRNLHVNTAVQYLIAKMLPSEVSRRSKVSTCRPSELYDHTEDLPATESVDRSIEGAVPRVQRGLQTARRPLSLRTRTLLPDLNERMPMPPQVQFEHARRLLSAGRYHLAAPHLARVAAAAGPLASTARVMLSQVIEVLMDGRDPRRIVRALYRAVRLQAATSWLRPADLECALCYHTYTQPVTTPCGHTFCRTCIERALDYRKSCALCLRSLHDFDLAKTEETLFVHAALKSIDALNRPLPLDPDVIPIFVCTVAYPSIPCPLFIFDPRYWLMIRRVLESGSRKFGMVAYERARNYCDYGTVLEVCDCVHLEDGRSFLSTVGVSRFRIIERDVRDGCDVARIQPLTDIPPTVEDPIIDMRQLGYQILYKALMWLNSMDSKVRTEIETAFGQIPHFEHPSAQDDWLYSPDGPAWLWWLIAILPLRSEIKVLILSTKNLLKRMMAVSRTLEAIDQVAITTTATSECEIRSTLTNAEEWLERGS